MTREDLRHDFHNERGINWENSQEEPDIDYVMWLENKILAVKNNTPLPPAEGAEHDIEAMRKCLHHYVNVDEVNRYDMLVFGAMRDYANEFAAQQQPPAEGAEEILKEGLDDGRYAGITDGINIDVKQPFYQAIIRYAEDVVAAQPQPTAEGAEEITAEEFIRDKIRKKYELKGDMGALWMHICNAEEALRWAHDFATLHAQRIADKMVSERLREELINYKMWESMCKRDFATLGECIDEYLKSREK